jgi:hypothetical protein
MKRCNEMLGRTIRLTEMMAELADLGDGARKDVGCGVLYGLLRDSAYKIRKVAEQEKEDHIRRGMWQEEKKSLRRRAAGEFRSSMMKSEAKPNKEDEDAIQS